MPLAVKMVEARGLSYIYSDSIQDASKMQPQGSYGTQWSVSKIPGQAAQAVGNWLRETGKGQLWKFKCGE